MNTPVHTIFLVDDDAEDQEIFRSALSEIMPHIYVSTASNGEEALQQLHVSTTLPDLIFMDINMPVLNGLDTLAHLRQLESLKHIPVIIYSTSLREESSFRASQLGALECIIKPAGFTELCTVLSALLGRKGEK